jgi:hypothetical protein
MHSRTDSNQSFEKQPEEQFSYLDEDTPSDERLPLTSPGMAGDDSIASSLPSFFAPQRFQQNQTMQNQFAQEQADETESKLTSRREDVKNFSSDVSQVTPPSTFTEKHPTIGSYATNSLATSRSRHGFPDTIDEFVHENQHPASDTPQRKGVLLVVEKITSTITEIQNKIALAKNHFLLLQQAIEKSDLSLLRLLLGPKLCEVTQRFYWQQFHLQCELKHLEVEQKLTQALLQELDDYALVVTQADEVYTEYSILKEERRFFNRPGLGEQVEKAKASYEQQQKAYNIYGELGIEAYNGHYPSVSHAREKTLERFKEKGLKLVRTDQTLLQSCGQRVLKTITSNQALIEYNPELVQQVSHVVSNVLFSDPRFFPADTREVTSQHETVRKQVQQNFDWYYARVTDYTKRQQQIKELLASAKNIRDIQNIKSILKQKLIQLKEEIKTFQNKIEALTTKYQGECKKLKQQYCKAFAKYTAKHPEFLVTLQSNKKKPQTQHETKAAHEKIRERSIELGGVPLMHIRDEQGNSLMALALKKLNKIIEQSGTTKQQEKATHIVVELLQRGGSVQMATFTTNANERQPLGNKEPSVSSRAIPDEAPTFFRGNNPLHWKISFHEVAAMVSLPKKYPLSKDETAIIHSAQKLLQHYTARKKGMSGVPNFLFRVYGYLFHNVSIIEDRYKVVCQLITSICQANLSHDDTQLVGKLQKLIQKNDGDRWERGRRNQSELMDGIKRLLSGLERPCAGIFSPKIIARQPDSDSLTKEYRKQRDTNEPENKKVRQAIDYEVAKRQKEIQEYRARIARFDQAVSEKVEEKIQEYETKFDEVVTKKVEERIKEKKEEMRKTIEHELREKQEHAETNKKVQEEIWQRKVSIFERLAKEKRDPTEYEKQQLQELQQELDSLENPQSRFSSPSLSRQSQAMVLLPGSHRNSLIGECRIRRQAPGSRLFDSNENLLRPIDRDQQQPPTVHPKRNKCIIC